MALDGGVNRSKTWETSKRQLFQKVFFLQIHIFLCLCQMLSLSSLCVLPRCA